MKRLLAVLAMIVLSGCHCLGSSDVQCWYVTGLTYNVTPTGSIWLELKGRTDKWREDVHGAVFKTQDELDSHIKKYNLKMCGVVQ